MCPRLMYPLSLFLDHASLVRNVPRMTCPLDAWMTCPLDELSPGRYVLWMICPWYVLTDVSWSWLSGTNCPNILDIGQQIKNPSTQQHWSYYFRDAKKNVRILSSNIESTNLSAPAFLLFYGSILRRRKQEIWEIKQVWEKLLRGVKEPTPTTMYSFVNKKTGSDLRLTE